MDGLGKRKAKTENGVKIVEMIVDNVKPRGKIRPRC
jgi:hypothetical protein